MIKTELKPNYSVELLVEGKKHFYKVVKDGKEYKMGGTTGYLGIINKVALVPWAAKMASESFKTALNNHIGEGLTITPEWIDKIALEAKKKPEALKDAAADVGTKAHKAIDVFIKTGKWSDVTPDIENAIKAFKEWSDRAGIEFVAGDTPVASLEYGYGGSLDWLGYKNGKYILGDTKTSSGIYSEYALQVAAYWKATMETFGIECGSAVIARFSKTLPVEFEIKEVKDLPRSFQAFLMAKNLSEAMKEEHYV